MAKLEALARPGGVFVDAMAEAVGKMVRQVRVDLEARIKAVEDRQLVFKGVHEPGRAYQPGNLVVRNGGLWHCNALTHEMPGKSSDWQLAVKSGEANRAPAVA